jgi:streptogramin lyase
MARRVGARLWLGLVMAALGCTEPREGGGSSTDAAVVADAFVAADVATVDGPVKVEAAAPTGDAPVVASPDGPIIEVGAAPDARKGANGEACTRHDDCLNGFCDGTCMAPFVAYPVPSTITDKDRIATGWDQGIWFTVGPLRRIGRMARTGMTREFTIPDRPGDGLQGEVDDVTNGPDSAVWFGMSNGRVGRVELDGTMAMFETGSLSFSASSTRLIVGPDRNIWYLTAFELYVVSTEPGSRGKILRTSPMGGSALVLGADGRVWVFYSSEVTVLNADGSVFARHTLPNAVNNTAVVVGPDNQIWYAGRSGFVRVNQQGVASMVEYPEINRVVSMIVGADGQLWFTEPRFSQLGRLNAGGDITYFPLGGMSFPTRMTVGPDGPLWYIDHGTGTINRLRR